MDWKPSNEEVISYVKSEFRRKWSLVGVLWLAVYKSVTHIPIHHDVSWAWPALRVLAEGRVASLYLDLFCCNGDCSPIGLQRPIITQLAADVR